MEGSSRPPPEMEFTDPMRILGAANGPPDILNMFSFIDSIGPTAEPADNGETVHYVTREQRMYAAEYCRLQDIIDTLSKEKEELEDKVSKCEQELLKAREPRIVSSSSDADRAMILELRRNENTLQSKLNDQKNLCEEIKSQLEEQNVKVCKQEEAIQKYESELNEATNTVKEREQEINEYRSVVATQKVLLGKQEEKISELGRNIDKLEEDMRSQQHKLEQNEKVISSLQDKLKEDTANLQQNLGNREEVILSLQDKLKDITGSLQQELGQKEEVICSLQDKLSSLEENLKTKQKEVEEMKQSLENEKKCKGDTEASFKKLQYSVSIFNLEFAQFIDELKTVTNFGRGEGEPSFPGPTNTTFSLQNQLEVLASHVKNKFQFLQNSQTMAKDELARIKEVVSSLKLMLGSRKPVNKAKICQSTQTELSEQHVFIPSSLNESPPDVEATSHSSNVLRKPSYSSVVEAVSTSEAEVQVTQSIFPPDNFEFPALMPSLSSTEIVANMETIPSMNTVANGMARGSRKIHGVDSSKSHLGLFCLCGKEYLSPKTLNVHINYFTSEWKFKCKHCTHRFFNLVYLNRHMNRSHGVKYPVKKGWSGCTDCGQKFPSRMKLNQHKKTVHTVQFSRKTIMKRTLSKLMSQPQLMKKPLSDGDKVNSSTNEVPKISLEKGKTRSQSSLWNVVSNEIDNSSSMMWESFDEDDTTEQDQNDDNNTTTTATNTPSTSKSVADNPRHGQDNSREGPGYFCFCGYHHPFNKNRLLKHIQYFTVDPKFSCQLCGKRFIGSNYLRRHCQRVHNIICADSTGCWKCGQQFKNRKQLFSHQKLTHGRLGIGEKTRIRNATFQHKAMPSVALSSQDSEAPTPSVDKTSHETSITLVKTTIPEKKTTKKFKIIIKHCKLLSRNGNNLPIVCVCGYKAKNEDCFRKHVKYFDKKCHFVCDVCDKGFKTTSNLRSHMQSAHQMSYNLKGCRLCGKVFETLEKLRHHQSVKHANTMEEDVSNMSSALTSKTNSKPSALFPPPAENCTGTGISFSPTPSCQSPRNPVVTKTTTTASIISVKRRHGVDLSKRNLGHYCICGTKSSDKKALNSHIHYLTAERKFQCKHCNLKFLHLARLKAHTKRTHKIINIEELGMLGCSDCGLTFHSYLELFQHRKIHSSIDGVSDSTPITDEPAQEPGIKSRHSQKDDRTSSRVIRTNEAISSLTVTKATTHTPIHPAPQNNARSTLHTTNSQSQPQAKRASAISAHKPVRFGNYRDLFYCLCGIQFETDSTLQRHIEDARSAEDQSCVKSAQVWTPPSHLNLNAGVEVTSAKRKNGDVNGTTEVEASPTITVSHLTPSSSTKNKTIRLDKARPLTHAIDKSKKNFGEGLFCICGLGFKSTVNMDQHFQFHRNGRKFSCDRCEGKFREMKMLNKHMKTNHGSDMTRGSQFGCRFCGQVFSSGRELSKHRTKIL